MINSIDLNLVDVSRAQFALTAIYHWLFVPLTLGLSFILAMMETIYYKTGREEWKRITRFWMTLFGINFAIGVATGIILEFEFGTNWSNYSWFVGDIFGAPLAIEGILAFFLESTFVAVMFFGWEKVSRKFHLLSTWLVAVGANLSALWILVANAWMENPVGVAFNPELARNEMISFWDVLFNPVATSKFLHTISSGFLLASLFVVGISSWFLLRKREENLAKKSILIAGVFGLLSSLLVIYTGDTSSRVISKAQPVKFASMEALYNGKKNAGLVAIGILKNSESGRGKNYEKDFAFKIEVPGMLSYLTGGEKDFYVPGLNDLLQGNKDMGIISVPDKIQRGKYARDMLLNYHTAKTNGNEYAVDSIIGIFRNKDFQTEYFKYFGFSSIEKEEDVVPNVAVLFYAFHAMVALGFLFIAIFTFALFFLFRGSLSDKKWFLWIALLSIPLPYLASELGWVLTEMGRQPWIIQNLMTVSQAVSKINSGSVVTTLVIFVLLFSTLLVAEISIMLKQINNGPDK
jgi:cytochrome bd ubiquinol oxidase subunit I